MRSNGVLPGSRAAATLAAVIGVVAISFAFAGHRPPGWFPSLGVRPDARVVAGCALVVMAGGVRRRVALGSLVAFGYFGVVLAEGLAGDHIESGLAAVAIVVTILAYREAIVWPTRGRLELAGRIMGVTLIMLIVSRLVTTRSEHRGPTHVWLSTSIEGIVSPPAAAAFAMLVALVVLFVLLQPGSDEPELDDDVHRRVALLCASPDSDSLAPFTRRRDKSYVFSDDGRAAIGYRVVSGVCVAGPGPVGATDAHHDALAALIRRCDERGWRPAMIGASDRTRRLGAEVGLHGISIGDEAVLPVATFRLDCPPMRNVRQAVKRSRNAGVEVAVLREGAVDELTLTELRGVVDEWRGGRGELGFSMTLDCLLDGVYPDALLIVARHHGRLVGFQRYLLCRSGTTLSLDVMPRSRDAPNGVNERLIAEAVAWGSANGVHDVSLNFAAFRTLFQPHSSIARRALRWGVHVLDPLINVESLYRFNAKFHPEWTPRHVLYRSPLDVPALMFAALRVEFGAHTAGAGQAAAVPQPGTSTTARGAEQR